MTKDRQISLNLTAKSDGKIKILGFCSTFMNVEIQFLINILGPQPRVSPWSLI